MLTAAAVAASGVVMRSATPASAVLALLGCGCVAASAEGPVEVDLAPNQDETDVAPRLFTVGLQGPMSTTDVMLKILEDGRLEIAEACAERPNAMLTVFSPTERGTSMSMPCEALLAEAADVADIHARAGGDADGVGEAAQPILFSPIRFLAWIVFVSGVSIVTSKAICPSARRGRDRARCDNLSVFGPAALGILCGLPL